MMDPNSYSNPKLPPEIDSMSYSECAKVIAELEQVLMKLNGLCASKLLAEQYPERPPWPCLLQRHRN